VATVDEHVRNVSVAFLALKDETGDFLPILDETKYFVECYNKSVCNLVSYIDKFIKGMVPMQYFTAEQLCPSKRTIDLIKQIAYSYNVIEAPDGTRSILFLN